MNRCECGSYAINPNLFPRTGGYLKLCDVCYFKKRLAETEQRLATAEARNQTYEEYIEDLGDRSDTCVYNVINKICSFCQCKRRGDTQW